VLKELGRLSNGKVVSNRYEAWKKTSYTERWKKGDICNLNYLMMVNKYASRSYNDINQYLVFPWVLSNYTNATLDISNEANFRNLE
jgi:hypothetical protein